MVETRASRSRAARETKTRASSHRGTPLPASRDAQPKSDTISGLMPFLMSIQETQQQILRLIADQ